MPKMHPLLEDALALFKGGAMTQAEYDAEVARIKRDEIGIGGRVGFGGKEGFEHELALLKTTPGQPTDGHGRLCEADRGC